MVILIALAWFQGALLLLCSFLLHFPRHWSKKSVIRNTNPRGRNMLGSGNPTTDACSNHCHPAYIVWFHSSTLHSQNSSWLSRRIKAGSFWIRMEVAVESSLLFATDLTSRLILHHVTDASELCFPVCQLGIQCENFFPNACGHHPRNSVPLCPSKDPKILAKIFVNEWCLRLVAVYNDKEFKFMSLYRHILLFLHDFPFLIPFRLF